MLAWAMPSVSKVNEVKHAQSDADFLSKMSIAYKEADETDYWMNLLHDNGYINESQFASLKKDMDRILKLLTSIVKTMNEKVKKKWFEWDPLVAIRFEVNCYLIVYGGVKLNDTIQNSPVLQENVFRKIDKVKQYLLDEAILDIDDI